MIEKRYCELDYVTLLQMKGLINRRVPDYEWRIWHHNVNMLHLDDGSQSYYSFCFDLESYEESEIEEIGRILANELGVRFK